MIHEVRDWMFDLPLSNYILTFDDGLYSQYYYHEEFLKFNTPMYYFVSANIICDSTQSNEFPDCRTAHQKAFAGNKEDYMTLEQIKHLHSVPNVTIGGHSYAHNRIEDLELITLIEHINKDTELMLNWFETNLNYKPTSFCFPYNKNPHNLYSAYLRKKGFKEFFGAERIPIEKLQPL